MKLRVSLVVLSFLVSIATGIVLSRGSATQAGTGKRQRPLIGLSMDTLKEERWQGDRDIFVKRAGEAGADVVVESANGDDVRQVKDIEALISRGVDALVIIPHDGAAMATGVAKAHEAGIPVLAYDRLITGCDLDIYMTFDNVKVGELQASFLAERLAQAGGGKKRIVRIYGSKTDNNAKLFKEGQDHVLEPLIRSGAVEVVHEDWAEDWRPENAKRIANAAITKAGAFDGILASNDGTAGGAIQALTEEGLAGKVIVTGQDAEVAACQRIVAGTQAMTIYKPLTRLAAQAAALAVKLAQRKPIIARGEIDNGQTKVPSVLLDVIAVTKENMMDKVVKDGFHQASEIYRGTPQP